MTRLRILTGPRKTFEPTSSSQIKSNATDNIKKHEVLIEIYKITNVMTKIISVLEISKTEPIMESIQSKCKSILVSFWICLNLSCLAGAGLRQNFKDNCNPARRQPPPVSTDYNSIWAGLASRADATYGHLKKQDRRLKYFQYSIICGGEGWLPLAGLAERKLRQTPGWQIGQKSKGNLEILLNFLFFPSPSTRKLDFRWLFILLFLVQNLLILCFIFKFL